MYQEDQVYSSYVYVSTKQQCKIFVSSVNSSMYRTRLKKKQQKNKFAFKLH